MKLTYKNKLEIYNLWKYKNYSPKRIAKEFHLNYENIRYMVHLIDRHGNDIVRHGKKKYYSPYFKVAAINRVLLNHESASSVSLELGLSNHGLLHLWMKSYKENGYTVVEKCKGRKPYGKEESNKDTRRAGERK